jgi:hypothetical protein
VTEFINTPRCAPVRGLQTKAGNPADARGRLLARVPLGSAIECLQPGPDHTDRPDLLACKKLAAAHAVDGKDRIGSRQRDSRIVRLVLEGRVDPLPSFPTERQRELRSSSTSRFITAQDGSRSSFNRCPKKTLVTQTARRIDRILDLNLKLT